MKHATRAYKVLPRIALLFLLGGALCAISSTPACAHSQTPTQVVEEYCQLDLKGARLSSDNPYVDRYFSLVAWEDEAGFTGMDITKGCRVLSSNVSDQKAEVTIEYQILGTIDEYTVHRGPWNERVVFVLGKSGGRWKIVRPMVPPHVSVPSLIANFQDLLKREHDPAFRRKYQKVITELRTFGEK